MRARNGTLCLMFLVVLSVCSVGPMSYVPNSFTLENGQATISLNVFPSEVTWGDKVSVSGAVGDFTGDNGLVALTYISPTGRSFSKLVSLIPFPYRNGLIYGDGFLPEEMGSWTIKASFQGKEAVRRFVALPIVTGSGRIVFSTDSYASYVGDKVRLFGRVRPVGQVPVSIEFSWDSKDWFKLATVLPTVDGEFSYGWSPSMQGLYHLRAVSKSDTYALSEAFNVAVAGFPSSARPQQSPTKSWSLMFYFAMDNNIGYEWHDDEAKLNELTNVGSNSQVNLVVLWDKSPQYYVDARTQIIQINPLIAPGIGSRTAVKQYDSNLNTGDNATLRNFLTYCFTNYPASHYALIIFDHGDGVKGFAFDDTGVGRPDNLDLPKLLTALVGSDMYEQYGAHLDVLGFDACLMAMDAVATQVFYSRVKADVPIKWAADYLVASEEMEWSPGWPYQTIVQDLVSNPSMDGRNFAITIVDRYRDYWNNKAISESGTIWCATISAIDINAWMYWHDGGIYSPIYQQMLLANALRNGLGSYWSQINATIESSEHMNDNGEPTYVDLYDFAKRLSQRSDVGNDIKTAAANLVTSFDQSGAIIREWHQPDGAHVMGAHMNAHGMTTYLENHKPPSCGHQRYSWQCAYYTPYDGVKHPVATNWNVFLRQSLGMFDVSVSMTPQYADILPGQSQSFTVTVTRQTGTAQDVVLFLEGFPAGQGSVSFTPSASGTPNPTFESTMTITISGSAQRGISYVLTLCVRGTEKPNEDYLRVFVFFINVV